MKTAIYIEGGVTQLVLTPDNEWERQVIRCIQNGTREAAIMRGEFYKCVGGWNRQGGGDESLILRIQVNPKDEHGIGITQE